MRTKNEILPLTITGLTLEGNGVGRYDGETIFVPRTAIGDKLQCRIVKPMQHYAFGILETLTEASPDRISPDCPVCATCGGCVFRHISYAAELTAKEAAVQDAFTRIGKLSPDFLPILGCDAPDGYRNKAQYPVGMQAGACVCGFYAPRSHRLIPHTTCALQPPLFAEVLEATLTLCTQQGIQPYTEETHTGILRHLYLRQGYHSKELMLCFVVTRDITKALRPVCEALVQRFPMLQSICQNQNNARTNVILGRETKILWGADTITDTLCGNAIALSPHAFYQINTAQAERLYGIATDFAGLTGQELLLDLYCGAGTIGLSMAHKAKRVLGVEIIPQAVENAIRNAERNDIRNAEFRTGDAGKIAAQLAAEGLTPDVIVLDPPRKGCDSATLEAVLQMTPLRIVMVSCNPATAARDCATLHAGGYQVEKAQAVDMFPRTGHVETVVLLTKVQK